ncbi:MAG: phospho-N-acetylmuramoyl-pentapeptide-transferase [Alphaproteobacteria bacterium]|nr:phospho-N-acetylmuramoyl-pentapeptide-transferase [Alphaproteobacteria bacterium]
MLASLLVELTDYFQPFNVLHYITFRSGLALMTAMFIGFLLGSWSIRKLGHWQYGGATVREDLPETHLSKIGTPSMGGILIVLSTVGSVLLWGDWSNRYVWAVMVLILLFGSIGFWDDWLKIRRKSRGLPGKVRLGLEGLAAAGFSVTVIIIHGGDAAMFLSVPFIKDFMLHLSWFMVPFAMLIIIGSANAVNLTDGLDGLAIVPVMIAAGCFSIISYMVGHAVFSDYLQIVSVPGTGELAVVCAALIGAGFGFLWFNAPPAKVFMGDTGSLAIGGALGGISVITKHEIVLGIIGGLFVVETLSVMIQVFSFRVFGRRVFSMAPLHHHFEEKGWAESTIVIRFWIIAAILGLVGLSTLKLR